MSVINANSRPGIRIDTTSIALTSVLQNIANNREIYLRLKNEVRQAEERGQAHDPISYEEAQTLPYLHRVLKEALRIHPSIGLPMWRVVDAGGATIANTFFPPGVSLISRKVQSAKPLG